GHGGKAAVSAPKPRSAEVKPCSRRAFLSTTHTTTVALAPQTADLIITARWVVPVEPGSSVLDQYAVVVRDGSIIALMPAEDARKTYTSKATVDLPFHVLVPGLI